MHLIIVCPSTLWAARALESNNKQVRCTHTPVLQHVHREISCCMHSVLAACTARGRGTSTCWWRVARTNGGLFLYVHNISSAMSREQKRETFEERGGIDGWQQARQPRRGAQRAESSAASRQLVVESCTEDTRHDAHARTHRTHTLTHTVVLVGDGNNNTSCTNESLSERRPDTRPSHGTRSSLSCARPRFHPPRAW